MKIENEKIREQINSNLKKMRDKKLEINRLHYEIQEIENICVDLFIKNEMQYCLRVNYTVLNKMKFH